MEARKLLDAAPYDLETVQVLKQALDEAWASIASAIASDMIENTRLSLAHAIVAHAGSGDIDRGALIAAALDAVQRHPSQQGS